MSEMQLQRQRQRQQGRRLTVRIVLLLLALFYALFPIIWIASASLDPRNSLVNLGLIPRGATLDNYKTLLNSDIHPFTHWLWNSIKVSTITMVLSVLVSTLAAYAFSRFRFRGRDATLLTVFLIQVFPNSLTIVATFLLIQEIGNYIPSLGLNSHGGLILVYLGGALGINTWLMKGFFDTVPRDLDESAMLDGASAWQTFTTIILPLVRPVLAVIFMLSFIGTYGDYMLAKVMLTNTQKYTVAVGLSLFIGQQYGQNWGQFAAGAVMAAIPTMILFYISQSQLQGGLTSGAVKG